MFWDVLGLDLTIIWAESLEIRVLPLLPKMGDLRNRQNWCSVYKPLSAAGVCAGGCGSFQPDLHCLELYHL